MMKQQPSASSLPPSRLCRILFFALSLKIFILTSMVCEPLLLFSSASKSDNPIMASQSGAAHAAESGAGAPPAVDPYLPDAGMKQTSTSPQTSSSTPGATPGVSTGIPPLTPQKSQGAGGDTANTRTLPPITQASQASANGTKGTAEGGLNREMIVRKQEELNRKEQELLALQKDISGKLEKMQMLENRLNLMMKDAKDTNDAKFRHLVDVLSNMKAKSAAQVLESLDQRTAVRVLAGMRGRQAGEILTFVRPDVAASLTEALTKMQLPLE